MKTPKHIGQDFTKQIRLNLFPGNTLRRGYYTLNVTYITDVNGITTMHHEITNLGPEDLDVIVGQDVFYIEARLQYHNSFPQSPMVDYHYNMRVDRLLLYNIAYKLLAKRIISKTKPL